MALEGSLQEVSLPTLAQLLLQEGYQACIEIARNEQSARLYLDAGNLCHAVIDDPNEDNAPLSMGEEAFYELLSWQEGQFTVRRDVAPPARTIQSSWDYLLMEGLRQQDEKATLDDGHLAAEETAPGLRRDLSETDAAAIRELVVIEKERENMATKSEQLQMILDEVVTNSGDIVGAAVVSNDGLLMASVLSGNLDGNRIAAVSAGLISLSNRSVQQLNQGEFSQTLIQATNGNVIAIRANPQASFVALTPTNINLGMVFLECRDAAHAISQAL